MPSQNKNPGWWLIWISGMLVIACTMVCTHPGYPIKSFDFTFSLLLASLPFLGLAVYARNVNTNIKPYFKNVKLSGVASAFISTAAFAIWSFLQPVDETPNFASMFWSLSLFPLIFGYLIGALIYAAVTKIINSGRKETGK
jgi:hypothetical protein